MHFGKCVETLEGQCEMREIADIFRKSRRCCNFLEGLREFWRIRESSRNKNEVKDHLRRSISFGKCREIRKINRKCESLLKFSKNIENAVFVFRKLEEHAGEFDKVRELR